MDQSLKQRLIGAVVITALAAIFVPMLFDDPIEESVRTVSELELPATPVETFTETSERLPANEQQAWNGEEFNNEYDDSFAPEPFVEEPVTAESHDETNAMPKQPSPSPTPLSTLSKQEIWYVQMGSFSQRENAFTFRNTLTAQGYKATVDEVSGGKVKSYRLLVGPESDKKRAEALQVELEKRGHTKGLVLSLGSSETAGTVAQPASPTSQSITKPKAISTPRPIRWYVQMGSFSKPENAYSLRDELKAQGFSPVIDDIVVDGTKSYRLRVGPEVNKDKAEALKLKLEKAKHAGAFIVSE